MSEIKQGYKQTKVGIIPEDWEIVKLGKLTTVETGKTPLRSNKQFWDNGTINWATTTEVNETYIVSTNEKITNQDILSDIYKRKRSAGIKFEISKNNDITVPTFDGSFEVKSGESN